MQASLQAAPGQAFMSFFCKKNGGKRYDFSIFICNCN